MPPQGAQETDCRDRVWFKNALSEEGMQGRSFYLVQLTQGLTHLRDEYRIDSSNGLFKRQTQERKGEGKG